jgi:hypothetical protein
MISQTALEFCNSLGELPVRSNRAANSYEGSDHEDTHLNRPRGVQHAGSHDRTMLGESQGQSLGEAQVGKVATLCDHLCLLGTRESEDEIQRKPRAVAPHLLIESLGRHTIKSGQVRIDDHALAPDQQNPPLNRTWRCQCSRGRHAHAALSLSPGVAAICDHLVIAFVRPGREAIAMSEIERAVVDRA